VAPAFCGDYFRVADNAELTQRQGQAYIQRSESPRFREESLHLGMRYARAGGPGPLAFGNARLTDRRAGRRWLFCREECKQRDSNHAKDHNVLGAILPVHPVRHGLRRHDCHREPMGKA